jgi:CIC family chloride channel protein
MEGPLQRARASGLELPGPPGRRLFDWLRGSATGLAVLSVCVGIGAGLGAIVFRYLIQWFTIVFTGYADYSAVGRAPHGLIPALGPWFVLLVPVIGGLIYGPLIDRFAREARGHGVPEVMLAVAERGGRIRPRVAAIKSLASAICIGAGGSVGREGPIVQIGSAIGSSLGQAFRVPDSRLRLLVACGAAGGISATFNAPIAGVMFGLELILRDFEAESFGVVVLSSVTADVIGRAAFGSQPFLTVPAFELTSVWEFAFYAVLGVLAAILAVVFIRTLYGLEDLADRVWRGPEALRPAAGGLVLGVLLLALPQMYGVGYPVLERSIAGGYTVWVLLGLVIGKVLATSITIAIGGSGGVFAPSLFMGAALGAAYGAVLHRLFPGIAAHPGAYGLVGMGAVFAAAARAPITSALIIFELTDDYRTILPLLFAIALATGIARLLTGDTIYTLKLRRRGVDITRRPEVTPMDVLTVGDAMERTPPALRHDEPVSSAIERFEAERRDALPVVDADGTYRGTVTARDVEQAMRDAAMDQTVGVLARETPTVAVNETLAGALGALLQHEVSGIPVLANGGRRVVGWLTHRDVLHAYRQRVARDAAGRGE